MSAILEWLDLYKLQEYRELFEKNHIGTDILHTLNDEDLKELGIPLGDRKRILIACSKSAAAAPSRRQITVVICDLVGSTPLSENTDAELFREYLQTFRAVCKNSIEKYNGYIHQFRGDAAIAYFGYPIGQEKSAMRACHAALEVIQALGRAQAPVRLEARIGIATGKVVVGADVVQGVTQENAVGVTPNMAARLQALCSPSEIVLCELTNTLVEDYFVTRSSGLHDLKGLKSPVAAYTLVTPIDGSPIQYIPKNRQKTPLSGRSSELLKITSLWNKQSASLSLCLLRGEAGVGKSRVVHEFGNSSYLENSNHIQLLCSSLHQNSALYPVVTHISRAVDLQSVDSDTMKIDKVRDFLKQYHCYSETNLGSLLSLLSIEMTGNTIDALQPHEKRQHYFSVVGDLLLAQSKLSRLLIVIEDMQWIDPTTQGLLTQITTPSFELSCMILLTARPEFIWPPSMPVEPEVIDLNPLNTQESRELVMAAMDSRNLSPDSVQRIVELTDGIPLYIEETTRATSESQGLETSDIEPGIGVAQVGVPPTLHDSLMARLDGLGSAKDTALAASVLGREFSRNILQVSLNENAASIQRDLNILVENGTLKARESNEGVLYQFNHGLLQNIAYESLLLSTRTKLHSQIANALLIHFQNTMSSSPELIAHHLARSERFIEAAEYWRKAGLQASQRGSLQETVAHYQAALLALDKLEQTGEIARKTVSILSGLAATLLATTSYRSQEVRDTANKALKICKEHGLMLEIAPFLYDIWLGEQGDGNHKSALEFASDFLHIAEQHEENEARMVANRAVAWSKFNLGDPLSAIAHLKQSRELYRQRIHRDLVLVYGTDHLVGVGCGQVQAEWCAGYPDSASATASNTIKAARQSGHVVSVFLAYQYAGCLLNTMRRDWKKTEHYANLLVKLGEENHFPQAILAGNLYLHAMQLRQGKNLTLYRNGVQFIESTQELGYLYMMPYWFTVLADSCIAANMLQEADTCLKSASNIIRSTNESWHLPEIYRMRGQIIAKRSSNEDLASEKWYCEAIALSKKQSARSWQLRATTSLYKWRIERGMPCESEELAKLLAELAEGRESNDYRSAQGLIHDGPAP